MVLVFIAYLLAEALRSNRYNNERGENHRRARLQSFDSAGTCS
jgi:hypothetical protein